MEKVFGYIRVSSKDQNIERQLKEMLSLGIEERDIFVDKSTGKSFDRPGYQTLKRILRKGDILYVHSIDRFGRNYQEIQREWEEITKDIRADIRVIDMPLLDTTKHKDTLGSFVNDLVLQVLAFIAERERENIKKRQREGIEAAKAKGKHLGRPAITLETLTYEQRRLLKENYDRWKRKEMTAIQFMEILGLKKSTFYKIMKMYEKRKNSDQ